MEEKDYKIEIIKLKADGLPFNISRFVKVTHIDSGISVTKYNLQQVKAKKSALKELEMLVYMWENICE